MSLSTTNMLFQMTDSLTNVKKKRILLSWEVNQYKSTPKLKFFQSRILATWSYRMIVIDIKLVAQL